MMQPFRVTFDLDGAGLAMHSFNPIHIDALLGWAYAQLSGLADRQPSRSDIPDDLPIPVRRVPVAENGWVFAASVLFPDGVTAEEVQYYRRKHRTAQANWTGGSRGLRQTTYKDWNVSISLTLVSRLHAYVFGDMDACMELLETIRNLGFRRAHGHGKVLRVHAEAMAEDYSIIDQDGLAQRFLPDERGLRLVRLNPPYWNLHERVYCCEIGDDWSESENGIIYGPGCRGQAEPQILNLAKQRKNIHNNAYSALQNKGGL